VKLRHAAPLSLLLAACASGNDRALFTGADPAALVAGGKLWLYPTEDGDALHAWTPEGSGWRRTEPLIRKADIGWLGGGKRSLWAPHMAAANGRYYLYYSVGPQEPEASRIGVAICDTPAGPCRDSGRALIDGTDATTFRTPRAGGCADDIKPTGTGRYGFEAIDPMVFVDPRSGKRLLYAGGSNGSTLRVFELAPDMVTVAREVAVDQPPCFTEGAWMHERGGTYYLSYSAGHWDRADYTVRYATAPSPTGPWTYRGTLLASDARMKGPGHHSFATDPVRGEVIVYHRWEGQTGPGPYRSKRRVAIAPIRYGADGSIAVVATP
jgi:beta-xylosidase